MTDQQDLTLGEMARSLARIEAAVLMLQSSVAPLGALTVRVSTVEDEVKDLQADVKAVRRDSATVAGGISVAAFIASWLHK